MRFASIGGSNAANYASAGKAVADSAAKVFAVQRKTGPDYAGLSKVAMKTASEEKIAGMKAAAKVAESQIKSYADVTQTGYKVKAFKEKENIKNDLRKAGGIAALGKIAGAGFLAAKDNTKGREYPKSDNSAILESYRSKLAGINSREDSFESNLDTPGGSTGTGGSSDTGGNAGKVTTGSQVGSPTSGTDHLAGLTKKDFNDMAFTISSEAALGTDDVFGVAANLVTRLRSGKYGSSIHEISHAPGQYEGVYTGRSVASPDIAAQLMSPEGRAKINSFVDRLAGRTEFKGQTMLHNRVKNEDPMFDPKGNFYHYAGQ